MPLAREAESIEKDEMAGTAAARTPLTEWRRRGILIAAAATAALGAPVRILDIRSAAGSASRWARKGRADVHPASPAPWLRRSSTASRAENEPAPGPETEQGGQGE
jgi:hypothetical protein